VPCATFTPKVVPIITLVPPPLNVVVVLKETVAVVVAEQAVHDVQGALLSQDPLVHPVQVESGQPLSPHQFVQAPLVHDPEEPQGPQPLPKGPDPPAPKGPAPLLVAVNVASGAAVIVFPVVAHKEEIFE
jgi:hypothetical protein